MMIHEKIRGLRDKKGLRQEDMAERLGISQSAYSRMETGEARLDAELLPRIAKILEVRIEELLPMEAYFHAHNNSGGNNGCQHVEIHFPQDVLQQILDRYATHASEVQRMTEQVAEMNKRLLDLLEKRLG